MEIKLNTMGSHACVGWWVKNGRPAIPTEVNIVAAEIWDEALADNLNWLREMGAVNINISDHIPLTAKRSRTA